MMPNTMIATTATNTVYGFRTLNCVMDGSAFPPQQTDSSYIYDCIISKRPMQYMKYS